VQQSNFPKVGIRGLFLPKTSVSSENAKGTEQQAIREILDEMLRLWGLPVNSHTLQRIQALKENIEKIVGRPVEVVQPEPGVFVVEYLNLLDKEPPTADTEEGALVAFEKYAKDALKEVPEEKPDAVDSEP
jgi:hypothetical protein